MKKNSHFSKVTGTAARLVLLLSLTVFLAACASHDQHGMRIKLAPWEVIANAQVIEDFKYYYDGGEDMPFTIVGLKNSYTLDVKFFKPFDPKNGQLKTLLSRLHAGHRSIQPVVWEIVAPDGKVVGIVHTSEHQLNTILGPGKTVRMDAPYSHGSHPPILTGN